MKKPLPEIKFCSICGSTLSHSHSRYFDHRKPVVVCECTACEHHFQIIVEQGEIGDPDYVLYYDIINPTSEEDVIGAVFNLINGRFSTKKAIDAMMRQHRTLQQLFTGLCYNWFLALSNCYNYDARNEASVKLAKKIIEQNKEDDVYLPLI
jgi:hypothetical protein